MGSRYSQIKFEVMKMTLSISNSFLEFRKSFFLTSEFGLSCEARFVVFESVFEVEGDSGEVSRHRRGQFEPKTAPKHQRRFDGFDDKILSVYTGDAGHMG